MEGGCVGTLREVRLVLRLQWGGYHLWSPRSPGLCPAAGLSPVGSLALLRLLCWEWNDLGSRGRRTRGREAPSETIAVIKMGEPPGILRGGEPHTGTHWEGLPTSFLGSGGGGVASRPICLFMAKSSVSVSPVPVGEPDTHFQHEIYKMECNLTKGRAF